MLSLLLKNYATFAVECILRYQTSLLWQFCEFSSLQTDQKQKLKQKESKNELNHYQLAKKGISDSPGLVDFAMKQVNSVLNLSDRQVKVFREFKLQKNCKQPYLSKNFSWLLG